MQNYDAKKSEITLHAPHWVVWVWFASPAAGVVPSSGVGCAVGPASGSAGAAAVSVGVSAAASAAASPSAGAVSSVAVPSAAR